MGRLGNFDNVLSVSSTPIPEGTAESSPARTGFPVGLGRINEPHAAFRKESRKRRHV
jgi:hypothetical protein